MKINILHIMQSLEPGGLENGVINLVNSMDCNKFQVHIYCVKELGAFISRINNPQTKVIAGKFSGNLWAVCRDIRKVCLKLNIDVVHTHGWGTFLVGVIGAKLARVKKVINGEHGVLYDETFKRRIIQRILFNWVDLNLTVCNDLKNEIVKRFNVSPSCFFSIINGVDTKQFFKDELIGLKKREELNIDSDEFVVGTVGRLDPVKNYQTLISAFAKLKKDTNNIRLLIVGEGKDRKNLEQVSEKLKIRNRVIMLGMRDDISELLNAMDIFVLPSKSEGLSNTILEAMACGIPVFASDVGGNPEIVNHGYTGILFPFGDDVTLCNNLLNFYQNKALKKSFADNAVSVVHQELSLEKMIKNYENMYLNLLGEN